MGEAVKKPPDLEKGANRKLLIKNPIAFRKEGARSVDKHRLVAQGQLTSKGWRARAATLLQMAAVALSRLLKKSCGATALKLRGYSHGSPAASYPLSNISFDIGSFQICSLNKVKEISKPKHGAELEY